MRFYSVKTTLSEGAKQYCHGSYCQGLHHMNLEMGETLPPFKVDTDR